MNQIPLSAFEFSAVPLLLQRLLPPVYAQHLHSTRFSSNGAFQLIAAASFFHTSASGFSQPSVLNFMHTPGLQGVQPCRVDSFGPFESGQ
jgi:hypothetical protein